MVYFVKDLKVSPEKTDSFSEIFSHILAHCSHIVFSRITEDECDNTVYDVQEEVTCDMGLKRTMRRAVDPFVDASMERGIRILKQFTKSVNHFQFQQAMLEALKSRNRGEIEKISDGLGSFNQQICVLNLKSISTDLLQCFSTRAEQIVLYNWKFEDLESIFPELVALGIEKKITVGVDLEGEFKNVADELKASSSE